MNSWKSDDGKIHLYCGDCLDVLKEISPNTFTSVITDSPYGLKFMGKKWDHGIPGKCFWSSIRSTCLPGAPLLAFGSPRTYHRLACAIEDAGWELRDCLMYMYGQGFPKNHDLGKAVAAHRATGKSDSKQTGTGMARDRRGQHWSEFPKRKRSTESENKPVDDLWRGYGTSLKPAWEPIVLAVNSLDGTYAKNAINHGVSGLNIEGCRIDLEDGELKATTTGRRTVKWGVGEGGCTYKEGTGWRGTTQGRWPANVIHDGSNDVLSCFPDSGSPSRFFYCAKANKKERTCDGKVVNKHPTVKPYALMEYLVRLVTMPRNNFILDPFMGSGSTILPCIAAGLKAVGIEKDVESFNTAVERVKVYLEKST